MTRHSSEPEVLHLSPLHTNVSVALPRNKSFSKITRLGSKGNLTGTPHGTGMKEVGSSIADNSSTCAPTAQMYLHDTPLYTGLPPDRRGNLTGTPRGTGMKEVGSSIADNKQPWRQQLEFKRLQPPSTPRNSGSHLSNRLRKHLTRTYTERTS
jgi:hypothetical protein